MAEDTSILAEIDEALRADKFEKFWRENRSSLITFCVMAVFATAASVFWRDHQHKVHEEQTTLLTGAEALAKAGKYDDAAKLYEKAEQEGGGLGALAAISHANMLMTAKQEDKAFEIYASLGAGKIDGAPDTLRDYGALAADTLAQNKALAAGKPAAPVAGAKEAAAEGRAFSRSFAETAAISALTAGDTKTAAARLTGIVDDDATPFSQRVRAAELLDSIHTDAKDDKK